MLSEQANKELIEAVVLGFGSCVVTDLKDPANHVALNMTRSERVNLLKDLKTQFGPSLTTEVTDSDAGPLMAAKSLLKGLQQDWRSAK